MKAHLISGPLATILFATAPLLAGPPELPGETKSTTTNREENPWSFRLATYGWMQSVTGTVGVLGVQSDVDVAFKDVLKDLNIGFMAVSEVRYKRWGFTSDLIYADLRGSVETPFNVFFSKADYEQKQFIGNFALSYRLIDTPQFGLDMYAGARVNSLDAEITLHGNRLPLPPTFPPFIVPNRDFGGSKTWVDPIIGGRFQAKISGPFFVRVGGDVGGFGVSSDLTWEVYGTLGVNVARNFSLGAGYRALGTDYTSGGFKYDVVAHGPVIGAEMRF